MSDPKTSVPASCGRHGRMNTEMAIWRDRERAIETGLISAS